MQGHFPLKEIGSRAVDASCTSELSVARIQNFVDIPRRIYNAFAARSVERY